MTPGRGAAKFVESERGGKGDSSPAVFQEDVYTKSTWRIIDRNYQPGA